MKRAILLLSFVFLTLSSAAFADVDDFEFQRFDAVYELGVGHAGESTLRVTESLVAVFPDYDQNRGIARYIPNTYQRRSLGTEVVGVSDGTTPRDYSVNLEGNFVVVESVVPEGMFVRGQQRYDVSYTQKNVIGVFDDTDVQEFYWDINGTGWPQPFGVVRAEVVVPPGLASSLVEDRVACYRGSDGSTKRCDVVIAQEADGSVRFLIEEQSLGPYQTVTIAIGFEPGMFVVREPGFLDTWWVFLSVIALLLLLVMAAVVVFVRMRVLKDEPGLPTIITEYGPPKDLSLAQAAHLLGKTAVLPTALLLDLAVKGHIRLREGEKKGTWEVLRSESTMESSDKDALEALIGDMPAVGEADAIPTRGSSLAITRMQDYVKLVQQRMVTDGFYSPVTGAGRWGAVGVFVLLGALVAIGALNGESGILWFEPTAAPDVLEFLLFIGGIFIAAVPVWALGKKPLSSKGSEYRDHLKGLRVYLELAEKDRLAFLQSPKGALREAKEGSADVLKLYEKVLPWAILLGVDKEWFALLERYYQDRTPLWVSSPRPLSLPTLLSDLSSQTRASYQSSSSGGSSGGGSAGGGGGGGGGGGR